MAFFSFKKTSPRRTKVRKDISAERFSQISRFANRAFVGSVLLWGAFGVLCTLILSFQPIVIPGSSDDVVAQERFDDVAPIAVVVSLISLAAALYIYHYQRRIIRNHARALALAGIFVLLLASSRLGMLLTGQTLWVTGTAVMLAVILTIAYDQRFALGMSIVYTTLACFTARQGLDDQNQLLNLSLFLTMTTGALTCCFSLREIRTRMKLLEVSTIAGVMVFVMAIAVGFLSADARTTNIFKNAGFHAGSALVAGLLIQSFLPLIERVFRIATSMTLLDYSDANQPLLKRLAMEAPGTFSHSLLIGSIAEAAAQAIGRNGLLCRVGAYYHDIGKINKPNYFVENEMGSMSMHKELSPAMSRLVIIGHVKDGVEMAKEYGLPAVIRQFIETHHGTTVVEYFYSQAKKQHDEKQAPGASNNKKAGPSSPPPSESEFRYAGPKPRTKEAAIVMLSDSVEGAVRSLTEISPTRIEAVVHNMAMRRLQDGQFDECDMSLRELSQIETSISKTLAAHYHGRIAYPKRVDLSDEVVLQEKLEGKASEEEASQSETGEVEEVEEQKTQ